MQCITMRHLAGVALVAASTAVSSCQPYTPDPNPPIPQRIELVVRNDGFLDANVYTALSNGARGARLGTVTGHSTGRLNVRVSDLQAGNVLVLRVHAIGANGDWLSQAVVVDPTDYAELILMPDASGYYRWGNLYSRLRTTATLQVR